MALPAIQVSDRQAQLNFNSIDGRVTALESGGIPGPPNGAAGGDLGGTYPNPTVGNLHLTADTAINHKLTNVSDPTLAQDAATKHYVDNLGTLAQQPGIGARAYTGSSTAVAAGASLIGQLTTEDFDTDNMHDPVVNPSRITIQTAGVYKISLWSKWNVQTGGNTQLNLLKNGVIWASAGNDHSGQWMTLSDTFLLVAGDYLEGQVVNNTAASLNADLVVLSVARVPGNSAVLIGPQAPAIGARAYNSVAISIPNAAWTTLTFDSERFDTDSIHDPATNPGRLTCRTAGKYIITGAAEFAPNANGSRGLSVWLNGANIIADNIDDALTRPSGSPYSHGMSISTVYDLAPGDYVELRVFQDTGAALNVNIENNFSPEFSMVRVPGSQGSALSVTSTLPPSPVDGQECYYLADATNGVVWHLKYRAASASTYKWEFIGGSSLFAEIETNEPCASDGVIRDLATVGPSFVTPLNGDYEFEQGAAMSVNNGGAGAAEGYCYLNFNGTTDTLTLTACVGVNSVGSGTQSGMRAKRKTGVVAGQTVKLVYQGNNTGGSLAVSRRWLRCRPVRVG